MDDCDTPTSDTPTSDTPTSDTPTSDTPNGDSPGATPTRRRSRWTAGLAAVAAAVAVPAVLLAPSAAADAGGRSLQLQDRCDPATFTAAQIDCTGAGDVTLTEFFDELSEGGHHAWRFSRGTVGLDRGQTLRVGNTGGETHSFTEVVRFGQGIVPPLNAAVPDEPPAVPIGDLRFVPSGGAVSLTPERGTHLYECLIHPWMRTTVTVR